MRTIINVHPVARPMRAAVGDSTHHLITLADAGLFVQRYGREGMLQWQLAAAAVDNADKNQKLIQYATDALDNAIKTERWAE